MRVEEGSLVEGGSLVKVEGGRLPPSALTRLPQVAL